jgi:hypothetical protein
MEELMYPNVLIFRVLLVAPYGMRVTQEKVRPVIGGRLTAHTVPFQQGGVIADIG